MSRTLTLRDVTSLLQITPMTVYLWRSGRGTREPLPVFLRPRGKRHNVEIDYEALVRWLERNKPEMLVLVR